MNNLQDITRGADSIANTIAVITPLRSFAEANTRNAIDHALNGVGLLRRTVRADRTRIVVCARGVRHAQIRTQGAALHAALVGLDLPAWVALDRLRDQEEDFRHAERRAEHAREIGALLWTEPRVVFLDDVLPQAAIYESAAFTRYLVQTLEPLIARDVGRGAQHRQQRLLPTLVAFYEMDLNVLAAASKLGVHRHTLERRLERIEELLGHSVRHRPGRLVVECAIEALALIGLRETL